MAPMTPTPLMLEGIPFFSSATPSELEALAGDFEIENFRRGEYPAGREFQQLDRYQSRVWFVLRGVVSCYTVTRQDTRKILFFLGPGKLLSHSLLGTRPNLLFPQAMTDAILLSAPREKFARRVEASPGLTRALLEHYETDLWRMGHQLKNTASYVSVERKLAIKLLKLCQDFGIQTPEGVRISFPLTVTQIAEFIGVPRETASRACKRLGEMGLLSMENRILTLPDREGLVAYYRGREPGSTPCES